jgi:hypothetical protein
MTMTKAGEFEVSVGETGTVPVAVEAAYTGSYAVRRQQGSLPLRSILFGAIPPTDRSRDVLPAYPEPTLGLSPDGGLSGDPPKGSGTRKCLNL